MNLQALADAAASYNAGQDLYEVYQAVALSQGVSMDNWDELETWQQDSFNATAALVSAELSDEAKQLLGRT